MPKSHNKENTFKLLAGNEALHLLPVLLLSLLFSECPTVQDLSRISDALTFSCILLPLAPVLLLCVCVIQRGLSLCRSVLRNGCLL